MNVESKLRHLDLEHATSDDVRELLLGCKLAAVEATIPPGICILRARRGHHFTKREEMTYCPAKYCHTMQRASLVNQTMFYGVISDNQSHLENARAICTVECSELCKNGLYSIGRETFTLSHWVVEKPQKFVLLSLMSLSPK